MKAKTSHASRMPSLSPYDTKFVNTLFDENENRETRLASEQRGLGIAVRFGAQGIRHELDQPWSVDEFDGVFGGEFFGSQREGARRDEEALVAVGVMNRSQEFLQDGRADHGLPLVFALNNSKQPIIAAKSKVCAFIAGAAHLLNLEAHHFKKLAHEFLERLAGERCELRQL
jgi:hypothetical protein